MDAYLAVYDTNDDRSRKSCQQMLLFGEPLAFAEHNAEGTPTYVVVPPIGSFWKYVSLPCPHCMFPHEFKRAEWNEMLSLPTFYDYTLESRGGDSPGASTDAVRGGPQGDRAAD